MSYATLDEAFGPNAWSSLGKRRPQGQAQGQAQAQVPPQVKRPACSSMTRPIIQTPVMEPFTATTPTAASYMDPQQTYTAAAADYKAICDIYGVCSPVEGFGSQPSCQLAPPVPGDVYTDSMKSQMASVMKAALDDPAKPPIHATKPVQVNMAQVTGFKDEELDDYMHTSTSSLIPPPLSPITETKAKANANANANANAKDTVAAATAYAKQSDLVVTPDTPATYAYGWDLAVFVLSGVLIILLMEQIFKLVIFIGMQQTVAILSPFLEQLKQMQAQTAGA